MPNWCDNQISIIANTPNDLVKFVRKYLLKKGGSNGSLELDFNKIIPEPKSINECPSKYIIPEDKRCRDKKNWFDWYHWHCDFWGTKWNVSEDETYISINSIDDIIKNGYKELYIFAPTAWCPCVPIILKLQEDNPNICIELKYYECGVGFAGEVLSNGSEIEMEVDHDDPDFREWAIENGFESEDFYNEYDAEKENE